jgi:hypothetical protein
VGTWGYKIKQDDLVCDVIGSYDDRLKKNRNFEITNSEICAEYAESLTDPDDGPLFWIALASAQWKYGILQSEVLEKVKEDFIAGAGLQRWAESDSKQLSQRRNEIAAFIAKINQPNPKPSRIPKIIIRPPIYQAGDCLSLLLENDHFGAAIVLASRHDHPEFGQNLIGVLDYCNPEKPNLRVFQARKWLVKTHHDWKGQKDIAWYGPFGYRKYKSNFEVVGRIQILPSDPKDSNAWTGWICLGYQTLEQEKWNEEHKKDSLTQSIVKKLFKR